MPAKKCFIFKYKTTPEKNDEELERLDKQIKEASKKRNYAQAQKLQAQYDYCMTVKEYFDSQEMTGSVERSLEKLENERQQEEDQLKHDVIEKSRNVIDSAEERLKEMEQKHQEEMEQLDKKFSDNSFAAVRMSSIITTMLKSEDYYAQKKNFQVAEAYRRQIAARAEKEILDTENNADSTITAAIEAILKRCDTERKGFHNHLNNQRILIIREAQNKLSYIKNKYTNLRFKTGGSSVEQLPNIREHEKVIYDAIEAEFEDIMKRTESLYASNSSPNSATASKSSTAKPSPANTRRNDNRKTRRGNQQRSKSKRDNDNDNDNPEEEEANNHNEEEEEFQDDDDVELNGTNEDLSSTVRNPRVLGALNKTINKNLAQTL